MATPEHKAARLARIKAHWIAQAAVLAHKNEDHEAAHDLNEMAAALYGEAVPVYANMGWHGHAADCAHHERRCLELAGAA